MNINKNNYEAFFLDYHEGNLTPQQVAEVLLFVEKHPELKEEFESFESFSLDDLSDISFENKSGLKKEMTVENREDYFISAIENNLNPVEQQLIERFLKQHPQYISDYDLFKKTKVQPDLSVVFADKDTLKDLVLTGDYVLISSVEGLLSNQENTMLKQQLAVDAAMQQSYQLYQQTRLSADAAIIFEDKEALKRKERKVIPFYYYVSIAAAILVLFGLSILFSNDKTEPKLAVHPTIESPKSSIKREAVKPEKVIEQHSLANNASENNMNAPVINKVKNTTSHFAATDKKEAPLPVPTVNEVQQTNLAQNSNENKEQKINTNPENSLNPVAPVKNEQPAIAQAQPEIKNEPKNNSEFLSLGQIAAAKIKEKTLDADALSNEKKTGKINKFSGWDALQVVAKGMSKLTGKKVEVKPTYNEAGEVTAYAFNAGKLGFSKEYR